jgi:hypothetical protein
MQAASALNPNPQNPYLQMTHIGNIEVNGVLKGVYILKTHTFTNAPIDLPLNRTDSKKCLETIDLLIKTLSHEKQKNLSSINSQGLTLNGGGNMQIEVWTNQSTEHESWKNFMRILNPQLNDHQLDVDVHAGDY